MRYDCTILIMFGHATVQAETELATTLKCDIKTIRFSSARNIRTLLIRFRTLWPIAYMPVTSMHFCTVALFTLLEGLEDTENKQAFVDLCMILRALACRWQLAKGMLRLIEVTAAKTLVAIPPDIKRLFKDFEAELWKTDDLERFSSLYPNLAVSIDQENGSGSLDKVELDRFLQKWDKLTI